MSLSFATALETSSAQTGPPGLCPLGPRLRALATAQLQQAEELLADEGQTRHASLHQARKCIRRVRASLALGARALGPAGSRLDEELGRLCRGLSRLRDAQALVEVLQRLPASAPRHERTALAEAGAAACQRRDRLLTEALARDPQFASRRQRLRAARQRLGRLDWQALRPDDIDAAVKRSERRARKAARRASKHQDRDLDWHVYRRRLRRLHQQGSMLAKLQVPLRPQARELERRAAALGEAQDDVLLLAHCGRRSPFTPAQRTLLRSIASERLRAARHA